MDKRKYLYNQRWRQGRYRWKDALKARPCKDCGGKFPPECMEFDHVRGRKTGTVNQLLASNVSKKRILAEIAKCELVCANCHRIRTNKRRRKYAWHL